MNNKKINNQTTIEKMEGLLQNALHPLHLAIIDDSQAHIGHIGEGKGHYILKITAQAFTGKKSLECHRIIHTVLGDMLKNEIHALQIEAKPIETQDLVEFVVKELESSKALDIRTLDVTPLTDVTDAMIICTATSTRHAHSVGDKLVRALRKINFKPFNSLEGQAESGWVLIDLLNIVVHIMLTEVREFYSLEKLWSATESSLQSIRKHDNSHAN